MKRVLTALVLIPAVTGAIFFAPQPLFLAIMFGLCVAGYREYVNLLRKLDIDPLAPFGYFAGAALLLTGKNEILLVTAMSLAAFGLSMRSNASQLTRLVPAAGGFLLGILYVFGGWRAAVDLRAMSPHWLFFACALNWAGDTAALYSGKAFGKHKLAPEISPAKTWEGSIGSVAASVIFGMVYLGWALPATPLWKAAILAAAGNILGQIGDLAESALKRGAGVKDSGAMLPGHGGWLDRVDSTLFALPTVLALLRFWP
jgi:phosphatidate cytidylyltransferase